MAIKNEAGEIMKEIRVIFSRHDEEPFHKLVRHIDRNKEQIQLEKTRLAIYEEAKTAKEELEELKRKNRAIKPRSAIKECLSDVGHGAKILSSEVDKYMQEIRSEVIKNAQKNRHQTNKKTQKKVSKNKQKRRSAR